MVFLFKEEGGFKTEDGLFIAGSGVCSNRLVSLVSEFDATNFFLCPSGVLSKDAVVVVIGCDGELTPIWCNGSFDESVLLLSSLSSIHTFLLSVLGIAFTLLRMLDGDLEVDQSLFSMFHILACHINSDLKNDSIIPQLLAMAKYMQLNTILIWKGQQA